MKNGSEGERKASWFAIKWRSKLEVRTRIPIILVFCFLAAGLSGNAVDDLYLAGIGYGGVVAPTILLIWGTKTK